MNNKTNNDRYIEEEFRRLFNDEGYTEVFGKNLQETQNIEQTILKDSIKIDKEKIYENIYKIINDGFFLEKYIELTTNTQSVPFELEDENLIDELFTFSLVVGENKENNEDNTIDEELICGLKRGEITSLQDRVAELFNSILIGCQLFDDEERIKKFVDRFPLGIRPYNLEFDLSEFGISKQDALARLNHGFLIHFTTTKICNEIQKNGKLMGYGKNVIFNDIENTIINDAAKKQKENDPTTVSKLNFLWDGWGVGKSSCGSTTNGVWMFQTPESLNFLFGCFPERNKEKSMKFVLEKISTLNEFKKKEVYSVMSNIYDRIIGEEQYVGCVLIDRDAFDYEIVWSHHPGKSIGIEQRPFNENFNAIMSNDCAINKDIDISYLKFLKIPTVLELERQKLEKLQNEKSSRSL